jgi:hypothetical protein
MSDAATITDTSADFCKVLRPGAIRVGGRTAAVFVKAKFKAGNLSITGVEGPMSNGDAIGSCGQIDMHLRDLPASEWTTLAPGWTAEMLAKLFAVWDEWHLNGMRPYDVEMKAAGWRALARREILLYSYTLTPDSLAAKNAAETASLAALKAGAAFTPTPAQAAAAALPYEVKLYAYPEDGEPACPAGYRRARHLGGHWNGDVKAPEPKTLGWISPDEHPDGLLTRKLRPDGPGYGSAWYREEVPADVLAFLQGLPDADRVPAWV